MADRIHILDGCKNLHIRNTTQVLREISRLRSIEAVPRIDSEMFRELIDASYESRRGQVNANMFMNLYARTSFERNQPHDGKIILIDEDLYSGGKGNNWVFGGKYQIQEAGLGTILLSTARLENENHARDVIKHEFGHMFGAPDSRRRDTYECLGLHCTNPNCVMHQEVDLSRSIAKSNAAARYGGMKFCGNCENDIRRYRA